MRHKKNGCSCWKKKKRNISPILRPTTNRQRTSNDVPGTRYPRESPDNPDEMLRLGIKLAKNARPGHTEKFVPSQLQTSKLALNIYVGNTLNS